MQKLLTARGVGPLAVVWLTHSGLSVLVIPWLATQSLPRLFEFWVFSLLAATLAVVGNWLIVEAVSRSDLSILGPINSYKPVVSLIPAVVILGERPGGSELAGIGLVLAGSWLLLGTAANLRTRAAELIKDRGIQLRFLALIVSSGEAVCLKRAILVSSPGITFGWWAILGFLAALPFSIRSLVRGWATHRGNFAKREELLWLLALVMTTGLMQYTSLVSFQYLPVGVALALFQLSTLLSVILGYTVFREADFRRRLAGAAVMALGAVLLILR